MTNDFMRQLDYWLGIPCCFFLSALNLLRRLIQGKPKNSTSPRKILYIKLSEMGAIVLACPLLERVRQTYPGSETFFLTFEKNAGILKVLGGIVPQGNIITIRDNSALCFATDTFRAIARLARERIDVAFDLEFFSRFTAMLAYMSGADKRIGFFGYTFEGLYRGNLLTHRVQYNPLGHMSRSYLSLSQVITEDAKYSPDLPQRLIYDNLALPRFISDSERSRRLQDTLKAYGLTAQHRLILMNPGEGNLPLREWPLENFIAVGKKLIEDQRNYVIIIGTGSASRKEELLQNSLGDKRVISLVDRTTLEELAELFCISDVLLVNDCGLAHIASLTPIKKIILFGPESPQVFGPLGDNTLVVYAGLACSPCLSALNHRNSACRENACLKTIRPYEVLQMIERCLL